MRRATICAVLVRNCALMLVAGFGLCGCRETTVDPTGGTPGGGPEVPAVTIWQGAAGDEAAIEETWLAAGTNGWLHAVFTTSKEYSCYDPVHGWGECKEYHLRHAVSKDGGASWQEVSGYEEGFAGLAGQLGPTSLEVVVAPAADGGLAIAALTSGSSYLLWTWNADDGHVTHYLLDLGAYTRPFGDQLPAPLGLTAGMPGELVLRLPGMHASIVPAQGQKGSAAGTLSPDAGLVVSALRGRATAGPDGPEAGRPDSAPEPRGERLPGAT